MYSYNGESSGTTTTTVTGTAEGNGMFVYNSKPTLSLASGSPSGSGIPGLNEVFRFNVSADSRGDIGVDEFTFVMSSTDNGTMEWNYYDTANNGQDDDGVKPGIAESELTLYDLDAPSVAIEAANANWIFYESDGTACVDDSDCQIDWIVLDLGTPDTVAAGDTITYSMYLDTTGASASNDDLIRIDLPADTTVSSFSGTDPDGTMIWDDTNGYGSNTDIDGTYLSLPVIGGTIVY